MKLRIEKCIYGGAGLARADGKAVFVPFTLPGELVEARLVENKQSFANAELDAVLEPAAERASPHCPYFGECGGCHYQHAGYAQQLEIKRGILRETLERAHLNSLPEIVSVSANPLGYRNRIRLHIAQQPFALCYKRRASRHDLPVNQCPSLRRFWNRRWLQSIASEQISAWTTSRKLNSSPITPGMSCCFLSGPAGRCGIVPRFSTGFARRCIKTFHRSPALLFSHPV